MTDFKLPELGENITSGDVLRVLVNPGDALAKDQPVLELETDKATIEVPSSVAGRVTAINVKAGDKIKVGQSVLSVEDEGGAKASAGEAQQQAPEKSPPPAVEKTGAAPPPPEDEEDEAPASRAGKVVDISRPPARDSGRAPRAPEASAADRVAAAAPSVRRMARELGVDINEVVGTSDDGRISVEDVKAHAKRLVSSAPHRSERSADAASAEPPESGPAAVTPTPPMSRVPSESPESPESAAPSERPTPPSERRASGGAASGSLPDFSRWGEVERQPMRAVRRKTAEHLSTAWATIPHVTQHDLADITALEELRKRYAKQIEAAGGALTITAIAVKVVAAALKVFPNFNVSLDLANDAIVVKKYVHIGIAVDTDRGLLVPVIRNADAKNIEQIAAELTALSEKARSRKVTLDEMQGGSFSISNLGGIGGSFFTPIVNAPEVAILGIARARVEPVYKDGEFTPRLMLPLSLSYDHRAIDGADGARFLRWIVEAFEQPFLLALQG